MANDLILLGRIKLRDDVTEGQIKSAILKAAEQHGADLTASEIDGFLESSSAVDSSYIELNDDGAEIRVQLRGYGSHHNEEASAIADAFSSLAAEGGHLLLIDDDAPTGSEDAITVHFVGATEKDKSVARIEYLIDKVRPLMRDSELSEADVASVREFLMSRVTPKAPSDRACYGLPSLSVDSDGESTSSSPSF